MYVIDFMCRYFQNTQKTEDRGRLPSHHITSPETTKFVKEVGERSEKKENIKEKKVFCKKALLQKAKRDRLVKKLKLQGEL